MALHREEGKMRDIIKEDTTINEAEAILKAHGFPRKYGWELVIGLMLQQCDYLEVHGYGGDAHFVKAFND